jgi:hypothetical protein
MKRIETNERDCFKSQGWVVELKGASIPEGSAVDETPCCFESFAPAVALALLS